MPKSVLDFPQMETARQDDVLYIIRGLGLDRDQHVTVVNLVDGIYRNAFSAIGTASRGASTQILARNGDFNGWLDLGATLTASEAAAAAEFRPHVNRRPLAVYRSRTGTTYDPLGYRSHTPGYPRMSDTEIGDIGPGMQKRRTTISGLYTVQDSADWSAWDGTGAWGWVTPEPMSASTQVVATYDQWDIGPLTERIDAYLRFDAVVGGLLAAEPVYVGLRVLPGWVGDLVIPFDVRLVQVNFTAGQTLETSLVFRLEDADPAQPLRYGGLAVRLTFTADVDTRFRGLLKLSRSSTGALSYGWAKEHDADNLGAS